MRSLWKLTCFLFRSFLLKVSCSHCRESDCLKLNMYVVHQFISCQTVSFLSWVINYVHYWFCFCFLFWFVLILCLLCLILNKYFSSEVAVLGKQLGSLDVCSFSVSNNYTFVYSSSHISVGFDIFGKSDLQYVLKLLPLVWFKIV